MFHLTALLEYIDLFVRDMLNLFTFIASFYLLYVHYTHSDAIHQGSVYGHTN